MKTISRDATYIDIIEVVNNLISLNNALVDMLKNLSISDRFVDLKREIAALEKKIIAQGDLIVVLLKKMDDVGLH